MLHLIQSNKMTRLADQLVRCIQQASGDPASLFNGHNILVQSPGMAQWLKLLIAEKLGIAANIHFPLPSSFIWEMYRQHFDDLPQESSFTKSNMTWKLMEILPHHLHLEAFEDLRVYLGDENELKRFQLCCKIADVFDQYLVYRPEWILAWEEGQDHLDDVDVSLQPWQPILWRELIKYSAGLNESSYHRANLHHGLLHALLAGRNASEQPVYIFGISALPQQQLEILSALSQSTEVYIFWCNPSHHFWGDLVDAKTLGKAQVEDALAADYLDVGNPLLSSWGKLGRDYQDMLLNHDIDPIDDFVEKAPQTLLETLQYEVLQLTHRGSGQGLDAKELLSNGTEYPKIPVQVNDHSLTIHSCHSKVRELETLHNYLLHQFNQDHTLTPADVIVMMPDVASYGPYIEGVFGAMPDALKIPFAISDRLASEESSILGSYMQLMNLHQSRMSLSEVLAILEVPSLRNKFDIDEGEFELLAFWLTDAGVRWGWDQQDKSKWGLPEERQNTWLFGLNRLLAGYASSWEGVLRVADGVIAPYPEIEGQQAVALGKFGEFSAVLIQALAFCQQQHTLAEKVEGAMQLFESLYEVEEQEQVYANQLRQAIEQIQSHSSQFTAKICQDTFVAQLQQNLQNKGVGQRFLAGSVNFCTLMPMRSIPFKIVCLLGMNDGDYPRQTVPTGFDLMRQSRPRKGDRSRRHDDRYLFLEAILSAQRTLFISYQGFSQKDNSERSPSILVSELIDYCQQCFCLQGDEGADFYVTQENLYRHLLTFHGLQPFNDQYFNAHFPDELSFNPLWHEVAQHHSSVSKPHQFFDGALSELDIYDRDTNGRMRLELDNFISFFDNPIKALFRSRWQTSMDIYHDALFDEEPFALDGLSRYQLNKRMVEGDGAIELQRLASEGTLPIGSGAKLAFQDVSQQSSLVLNTLRELRGDAKPSRIEIDLPLAKINLMGWSENLYRGNLIRWRSGKIRAKDKLVLLIEWMAVCATDNHLSNSQKQAHFVGTDSVFSIPAMTRQSAKEYLMQVETLWFKGQQKPLMFFPETAWQWMKTADPQKAVQTFMGNSYQSGEASEPHIARACPDLNRVMEEFVLNAQIIFSPLFDEAKH